MTNPTDDEREFAKRLFEEDPPAGELEDDADLDPARAYARHLFHTND